MGEPAERGLRRLVGREERRVYNIALRSTTAARGALALSTLPLLTMLVGAALRVEPLTPRKTLGVLVAMSGVAVALGTGLATAPPGAWRGDLTMIAAALCMAVYNVGSRPFIARSAPLVFTASGMGVGAGCLVALAGHARGFDALAAFSAAQWLAIGYLAAGGGALAFYLWVWALERTTPTRVATTITVNPIVASLMAALLLGEPIGVNVVVGVVAVFTGIWIATTAGARATPALRGRAGA